MRLNILLATSQIRHIDGSGGLGDVPLGLAKVLNGRGDVGIRLVMPGYDAISGMGAFKELEDRFRPETRVIRGLPVPLGGEVPSVDVHEIPHPQAPQIPCSLLRCPEVFDSPDKNAPDKAVFFGRAVVELVKAFEGFRVDVIHCNDWHTGLIPVYLKTLYRHDPYLGRIATLYTTHNAEGGYQGDFPEPRASELLALAGLSRDRDTLFRPMQTRSLEHQGKLNFTKGGLGFADLVNTVSLQYRRELLTSGFGGGLEGAFRVRGNDFFGVLNGLDAEEWDPAADPYLDGVSFSAADAPGDIAEAKAEARRALREWRAPDGRALYRSLADDTMLAGVVSRIDYQKAPILAEALDRLVAIEGLQLVVLGSAGRGDGLGEEYARQLRAAAEARPDRVLLYEGFSVPLSHLISAASGAFLVPSVFEPCGLTQMSAMRYGSVPIVRAVGGLVDTVIDEGDPDRGHLANGFVFRERGAKGPDPRADIPAAADELVRTVERARDRYFEGRDRWLELVRNGMARDQSWTVPAAQYLKLYHEAVRQQMSGWW